MKTSPRRSNYQDQQAAGLLTISELKDKLNGLEKEKKAAKQALDDVRDRQGRVEALENERAIVLAIYAGFAGARLNEFPPAERQRIYRALGLRVTVFTDGRLDMEVAGGDYFPGAEEAYKLVEGIISERKRDKAYQEKIARMDAKLRRAGLGHVIPEERRVPTEIAS